MEKKGFYMNPDQHRMEKKRANLNSFYYEAKKFWSSELPSAWFVHIQREKRRIIFSVNKKDIWLHTTKQPPSLIFGQVFGAQE